MWVHMFATVAALSKKWFSFVFILLLMKTNISCSSELSKKKVLKYQSCHRFYQTLISPRLIILIFFLGLTILL